MNDEQIEEHVEDFADDPASDVTDEVQEESEVQPEAPQPAWNREDEEEARLFGWKSPDEWQGEKPEGYIDNPQEFLDRVQRSRIFKTMQDKLSQTESASREQARKLEEMNARALERQKAQYEQQMQQIVAAQRSAVLDGDTERFDALEKQKSEMKPPQEQPQQPSVPPEVASYKEQNDWAKDPVLWQEAVQAVEFGLKSGALQTPDAKAQLEFAERTIRTKYPHLFQTEEKSQRKTPPQTVDPGGLAQGIGRKAGAFSKLPADAKAQFQRYVSEGLFEDTKEGREEYANEYNAA